MNHGEGQWRVREVFRCLDALVVMMREEPKVIRTERHRRVGAVIVVVVYICLPLRATVADHDAAVAAVERQNANRPFSTTV